ncbi:hypothetical protein [Actinoalloteichus hymeniacidonis]|uniref:Uncharacterized protein n=1 Tax=Actinoalloteichus hymeniacidonis TaxID=340345 RepID=A0AAC9MV89_9PSEU|nr:hypothetical protein [Actinoalloteichus hymeniacidonis]AOS60973.1 hypothetical protein TL08_00625 [Actinoalloteichus hymeniacidonis]MBB5911027.1 hypothetical protein [Actinoalloteichus hymeniacidonis]
MTNDDENTTGGPQDPAASAGGRPKPPTPRMAGSGPRRGQIRQQDETTKPREPTLAEKRARLAAERRQKEAEELEFQESERKRKIRKRVMIGGGVTLGVVALIAVAYASRPEPVTAYCVDENGVEAEDERVCDPAYAQQQGGTVSPGGIIFLPGFGGGGNQYHYNYGGTPGAGGTISGGTTVRPDNAEIRSKSGSTIQRGGFGTGRGSGGS